ncbi:T9SS type A sorting domain-containing protein [Paenimyroides viscosum]|uniref:T9SS C-terminal target domain-containing protein n=1 Tax=Paenimyroides viscosum TaxID=2488729 RepID=A0A3P1B129_9FLAO|nr:T9SS type A sorting domain-containing protein [Paenimyroides viscosum]RRA94866.1 T9SS C-terminal target domain-containing protein [Paenimyroides viscosum]
MKHLYIFLFLIAFQSINAQVLWSDDFDSHPVGLLSTDPTGVTPGYGGWYVKTTFGQIQIVPETGRGNILAIGWVQNLNGTWHEYCRQENVDVLWNARNKNNNILKFEFETQAFNVQYSYLHDVYVGLSNTPDNLQFRGKIEKNNSYVWLGPIIGAKVFTYYNNWIKVEIYIDYTTNTIHFYAPGYIYRAEKFNNIGQPDKVVVGDSFHAKGSPLTPALSTKMDNMKITAIPTLPSYILNIDEILASKFNVFPNPASDIVTITNNENIGVEQVEVYDINGKNIKSQNYSSQNEIQLNISDFAPGTYMFHIKTNQGTTVKKVVKK